MVNPDTSESLLDKMILQIFEEQEDSFSFPLTTMKQTRDFVRLLNRQGFTYEMICSEIDEKCEAFRNWRLGGGPDAIGRRTMTRINKPFQEAMLSDGEEEDEETVTNGTLPGDKASGGTKRKKSVDAGGRARRSSKVDSVDGEKGNAKVESVEGKKENVKVESVEGKKGKVEEKSAESHTKKGETGNKSEDKGQTSLETGKNEVDTKDGRNKVKTTTCDNHSKPSSINVESKSENATKEKREEMTKDNAVTTAKDATTDNSKLNDQSPKAVAENVNKTTKEESAVHAATKDVSKDVKKKEHEAETGKKEPEKKEPEKSHKEPETRTAVNQKVLDKSTEAKPKTPTEHGPKSPSIDSQKPETETKQESTKKVSKEETKEEKSVEKVSIDSPKPRPTSKLYSAASPKKAEQDKPRSSDKVTNSSTPSSNPSSPTAKQIPDVQTPSDRDTTHKTKANTEPISPPTKDPTSTSTPSKADQKSDPDKTTVEKSMKSDKQSDRGLETKILPDASKTKSETTKALEKETLAPLTLLTTEKITRSKSETTVNSKTEDSPKAANLARTSSDNSDLLRPTAATPPTSPKTDSEATKAVAPPSDTTVDESYDSDLDPDTKDHNAEERVLIGRLHSLKRNQTKDGPGHLFVFSDTPAATGTGKHRVRIGNSRFPEKRLEQAQLFNPDIRMVSSVAVAMRRDALCRAQDELKSMSLRGKRGWYWGSLEIILRVVTDLSLNKEESVDEEDENE